MRERNARGREEKQDKKFPLTFVEVLLNFRPSCLFRLPPRQGQCSRRAACRHAPPPPRAGGAPTPPRRAAPETPAGKAQRAANPATNPARRCSSQTRKASSPPLLRRASPR